MKSITITTTENNCINYDLSKWVISDIYINESRGYIYISLIKTNPYVKDVHLANKIEIV